MAQVQVTTISTGYLQMHEKSIQLDTPLVPSGPEPMECYCQGMALLPPYCYRARTYVDHVIWCSILKHSLAGNWEVTFFSIAYLQGKLYIHTYLSLNNNCIPARLLAGSVPSESAYLGAQASGRVSGQSACAPRLSEMLLLSACDW